MHTIMVPHGSNPFANDPEEWTPDLTQCKWFRRAMTLVEGHIRVSLDGGTKPITVDAFDGLCDEFITDG